MEKQVVTKFGVKIKSKKVIKKADKLQNKIRKAAELLEKISSMDIYINIKSE